MVSIHTDDRKDDAMTTTTHRLMPLEGDAVSTLVQPTSTSRLVVRRTQRWSHWNDPRLAIPSVPAS
jgi:hypothetical protein